MVQQSLLVFVKAMWVAVRDLQSMRASRAVKSPLAHLITMVMDAISRQYRRGLAGSAEIGRHTKFATAEAVEKEWVAWYSLNEDSLASFFLELVCLMSITVHTRVRASYCDFSWSCVVPILSVNASDLNGSGESRS